MSYMSATDMQRADEIFASIPCARELAIMEIIDEVASATGIPAGLIVGESRRPHIVAARQLAMLVAHTHNFTNPEIGRAMGRDSTTVLHGIRAERIRRGEL